MIETWPDEKTTEVLLIEDPNRYSLFPIRHLEIYAFYKRHMASFWTVEEIDLTYDHCHWASLSLDEKHFVSHVLGFFAGSDGIVMENIAAKFLKEVQPAEARLFYSFQLMMEGVHSETYALLIDTVIKDPVEKSKLFNAIQEIPCIKSKADWALKWINDSNRFAERLVAFACVEGIFFSGSFCAIFWLKKRGKMPGLTFSNELISRDEGLHCEFACLLYSMLTTRLSEATIHQIVSDAVVIEKSFILDALPCALIGMNCGMMSTYIEFCADRLLTALGYNKIWKVSNPFEWMEMISLQGKTNFFEKRVAEYQKSGVMASLENKVASFTVDEDF